MSFSKPPTKPSFVPFFLPLSCTVQCFKNVHQCQVVGLDYLPIHGLGFQSRRPCVCLSLPLRAPLMMGENTGGAHPSLADSMEKALALRPIPCAQARFWLPKSEPNHQDKWISRGLMSVSSGANYATVSPSSPWSKCLHPGSLQSHLYSWEQGSDRFSNSVGY